MIIFSVMQEKNSIHVIRIFHHAQVVALFGQECRIYNYVLAQVTSRLFSISP
jgi:hypothetical protein